MDNKRFAVENKRLKYLPFLLLLSTSNSSLALNNQQDNYQQLIQSQSILEQRQFEQVQSLVQDSLLQAQELQTIHTNKKVNIPKESPCFQISQIIIDAPEEDQKHFHFLTKILNKKSTGVKGQCVGTQGLQSIIAFAQNQLINQGYVTSHTLIEPQDLSTGRLVLSIKPGRVANIYRTPDDININVHNALTLKNGDVLSLRELEHGVQNLRLPHNVKAKISIEPSNHDNLQTVDDVGYSDLVISRTRTNKIGIQAIVNNFGNHSTGTHQGGIGLNIAEPLWSNDNLYLQYMHTLDGINDTATKSNHQNFYASYRYPFRNWQLQLSYQYGRHTQLLNGFNHNPIYKGKTARKQAQISRNLYRNSDTKITGYSIISHKDSQYYIDDLEILVQRRKNSSYELGVDIEKFFDNQAKLNLNIGFNKGVGAFNTIPSPERYYRDVDSRPLIWQASGNYRLPINTKYHQWGLNTRFTAQYSNDTLPTAEQFTIGDRHAVRGFDGTRLLSGDKGMVLGQEVYYKLPTKNPHQIYFAIDKGWVSADGVKDRSYYQAAGSVLGYRFGTKHLNFDGYVGIPISGEHLSKNANVGIQLAWMY